MCGSASERLEEIVGTRLTLRYVSQAIYREAHRQRMLAVLYARNSHREREVPSLLPGQLVQTRNRRRTAILRQKRNTCGLHRSKSKARSKPDENRVTIIRALFASSKLAMRKTHLVPTLVIRTGTRNDRSRVNLQDSHEYFHAKEKKNVAPFVDVTRIESQSEILS